MKILQGIDLVKIARIEEAITRQGKRFLERVFSPGEQAYCGTKRMKYEHYAARFAAKEAFIKALGVEAAKNLPLREIEVKHEATGKPYFFLTDLMKKKTGLRPQDRIELSVAHEREYAVATVVVVKP